MGMSRRITLAATATVALALTARVAFATEPAVTAPSSQTLPASPETIPPGGGSLLPKASAPAPTPFTLKDRYFDAARRGDLEMLKVCLDKGIDPKIEDEVGRSGLDLAIRDARDLEIARFLHERGAPVDDPDAVGRTALHEAAGNGDTAAVKWLLAEGARPDRKDLQGRTPLHNAIMGGSREITLVLLEAGVDPNVRDNFQDTPLILACNKGVDEIAKALVAKGADPLLKDQEGRTAAQRAAHEVNAPYCKALPGAGPLPESPPPPAEGELPIDLPGAKAGG